MHILAGGFDLLILDLRMPELDGFEVLRAGRPDGRIPVIVTTGHYPKEVVREGTEGLNVETILRKPVMITTVLNAVRELTSLRFPGALRTSRSGRTGNGGSPSRETRHSIMRDCVVSVSGAVYHPMRVRSSRGCRAIPDLDAGRLRAGQNGSRRPARS